MNPFEIRARGNAEADVFVYGDIGASWFEESITAAKFVRDLQNVDAKTINVRINSFGGAVSDALAIYNALQRHPAQVNTFVDGVALSAASLIAMAGKTVTMAENGVLMIHGPRAMASGTAQEMREAADVLDKFAQAMAPSYASKTGKSSSEMLALLTDGADHWYTATEAQAAGFADEVSAAIPAEASFDLRRFRSAPAAAAAFSRSITMPGTTQTAAATPAAQPHELTTPVVTPVAAQPAAATAAPVHPIGRTAAQNEELRVAFAPFMAADGVRETFTRVLLDPVMSVERARAELLATLGNGVTPANPQQIAPQVEMGASEADKFRAACSQAILARAGQLPEKERADLGQNPHRGARLVDIARASLERIRIDTRGMSQMDIVAAAFTQSTSDFPILLENTMHKTLQAAYAVAALTWRRFCAVGSVSDFRAHPRYRAGSLSNLDSVNELGEFKNKTIPDGEKSSITAGTKGNIINLSRQAVVNDDLGAFVGLAASLGRAAARTIEADVYALLALNSGLGPTMSDTYSLFHANHSNIATAGAISMASLDVDQVVMASQKDVGGNDYLDLRPAVLLVPLGLRGTAVGIIGAEYDPDTTGKLQKPNIVKGMVADVVGSPRLTGTRRYLFANPAEAPVLEVAFLDGQQDPYLETQAGFTTDGAMYKVRLDYGTAAIDYRGAVTNAGA